MPYIGYLFFRFIVFLFSLIPFPVLYTLSDGLSWFFYKVIKYRGKVIFTNLRNSFPEKSEEEIQDIARKFYRNFTDILLEGIKGFTMSEAEMSRRYQFTNPELVYNNPNTNAILMAGHLNNWEWGATIYWHYFKEKMRIIGFYKPLSNKFIEKYGLASRSQFGTTLIDIGRTAWAFDQYQKEPTGYILVSDQSIYSDTAHWVKFLNQDTVCPHGGDKYARQFNYPVYFVRIKRLGRGMYEVEHELLIQNPASLQEGDITNIFMKRLEEIILEKPEEWLWSHKRWKVKKQA
jgi:Kdo2-lipid IVA lauroyltransferase/acyltransferase